MKKVFLIVLIAFLSVIGALGLGIGGMYLFGGFNEKIVYASEIHFNETEKVSAESIFLQIDTDTEGVTRKTLKLTTTAGGERIVNFPSTVNIGETFRVIPRQENGINIGGNVTLVAYYDTSDANVDVQARCNILIDIPIQSATVNLSTKKLRPEQTVTICEEGTPVLDALNIEPLNSLVPYKKSGTLNETIKETLVDKVMVLELVYTTDIYTENLTPPTLVEVTDREYAKDKIEIKYEYDENNRLVFANTIRLKTGTISCDAKLNLYVYPTYKDQNKHIVGVDIDLNNKEDTILNATDFLVGSYVINNITIFDNRDDNRIIEEEVLLNKEIKIYINNADAGKDDINLNLKLEAGESQNVRIGNLEYKNNVYLKITDENFLDIDEYFTLTKSDGTPYDAGSARGININCSGIGDQLSTWYWVLKINNFQAYYRYMTEQKKLVATLEYYQEDTVQTTTVPNKRFNIIPAINEVKSLTPKYPDGESAFRIKSGEELNLSYKDIIMDHYGVTPTFTNIAFYIDYSENSINSATTISTIPTQLGTYKATFNFVLNRKLEQSQLNNLMISPSEFATVDREKCVFTWISSAGINNTYSAEVYLTRTDKPVPSDGSLFYISIDDQSVPITQYMVKFYEEIEDSSNNFKSIPYLSIGGIRYYIDFDFVQEGTGRYLKINDKFNFDNAYTVSGIGSIVITAQLVYIEEGLDGEEDTIYWLTSRVNDSSNPTPIRTLIHIDIYEELSTLFASSYENEDDYDVEFNETIFSEEDGKIRYIFITSNEIEALKNYIAYGQVKVTFRPYFTGFDASLYRGIEEINKDAITFGSDFIEVRKNNVVIGYRLAYIINSVDSIEINNMFIDNIFRIEISIDVNGKNVLAQFKTGATENNFLDIKIDNRVITEAVLNYNTTGNNGSTTERAIELRANVTSNGFTYNNDIGNWEDNLRYYFKYNQDDTNGIIDSMSYGLRVVDESLNINLNNLYTCNLTYNDDINMGRGGLTFYNFPVVYNNAGVSQGVLVEFSIFSIDNDLDFNTHYYYDRTNNRFLRKLNDNLSAKLYFRIYGVEIEIEANNEIDFVGFKGNTLDVFGGESNENSIFNIKVKSGNGIDIEVTDYSQIFTAMLGSRFVSFTSNEYSQIIVDDDVLTKTLSANEMISFSFHIGSTSDANMIKIKYRDNYVTTYYLNMKPAFTAELTNENEAGEKISYYAPSSEVEVVKVKYSKEPDNEEIVKDLVNVSVQVVRESLPKFNGISKDVVTVDANNRLIFITVPSAYTFTIKLILTKDYLDEKGVIISSANCEQLYEISVVPIYNEENLTVGEYHEKQTEEDSDYWFITAGVDGYANFIGNLNINKADITSANVIFEDIEEDKQVPADRHMSYSFHQATSTLRISSRNLNYNKDIKLIITLTFKDGGNYVYEKVVKVLGNMTLEFRNTSNTINVSAQNNTFNLINESIYNFTINGVDRNKEFGEDVIAEFIYSNPTGTYNKDSFVFDSLIFEDMTPEGRKEHEYYYLRVRYENFEKDRQLKTIIRFNYVVDNSYTLVFELELTINIQGVVSLDFVGGNKELTINSTSSSFNLIDESLYNFTVNNILQNERFKEEVLDVFDYNNLESLYNKNNFSYDSEIFEDVTVPKADVEEGSEAEIEEIIEQTDNETINAFLLKVKYDSLEKGTTIQTEIKFTYKSVTGNIVFTLKLTINIQSDVTL